MLKQILEISKNENEFWKSKNIKYQYDDINNSLLQGCVLFTLSFMVMAMRVIVKKCYKNPPQKSSVIWQAVW
uniref:ATP synthase F0 subunit 8 n=1 Tax=Romanomermis culicivorax TaxID=13658 RepID=A0A915I670_ROMCU